MDIDRRGFIGLGAAFLAAGCRTAGEGLVAIPRLRFGVVSDIHVTTPESAKLFKSALQYFAIRGADAVVVPGDLTDWGLKSSLKYVKEAWDDIMGGTKVVPLFCTGNHDYDGWGYGDMTVEMYANGYSGADHFSKANIAAGWKEVFGEEFAPMRVRAVKGYDFVSAEWELMGKRDNPDSPAAWMKRNADRFRKGRPFFYFQHAPIKGTTPDGNGWGDGGVAFEALKDFPNAIAITGHSHVCFNDERSIWQGEFTAVSTPSLSYQCDPAGYSYENGGGARNGSCKKAMQHIPTRLNLRGGQGFFVTVYDKSVVFERVDFEEGGLEVAPQWVVPLDPRQRPYAPAKRAAELAVPEFPAGAQFTTTTRNSDNRKGEWTIVLNCEFPAAVLPEGQRVLHYEITAVPEQGKPKSFNFLSPGFFYAPSREPKQQRFWMDVKELPMDCPYVLEVRAVNSFGKKSKPLVSCKWQPAFPKAK